MIRIAFLFILLQTCIQLHLQAQNKYLRVSVDLNTHSVADLARLGLHVDHGILKGNEKIKVEIREQELKILQDNHISYEILIDDLEKYYEERNKKSSKTVQNTAVSCHAEMQFPAVQHFTYGSMGGFYTLDEIYQQLDSMRTLFPQYISAKTSLGTQTTAQGRFLFYVRVSDNPDVDENEPEMLFTALHHAREPESVSLTIYYLWYLLENAQDPEIQRILTETELYFIPCVNPDGLVYNQNTNPNGGGMWRKNRRAFQNNVFGVDLNRNYGFNWGFDNTGSSPDSTSDTYRGTSAFSEPETQLVRDFAQQHQFQITLNYHTYSNMLVYPWGYVGSFKTPDSTLFDQYGALLTSQNGYVYGTGDQTVGYVTNGDSDDWMYGEQNTKPKILSMTPEAGGDGDGFWPTQSRIIPIAQENLFTNLTAPKLLLEYAAIRDKSDLFWANQTKIVFDLQRIGMKSTDFTVSLIPLQNVASVGNPLLFSGMNISEIRTDSISITPVNGLAAGSRIKFILQVSGNNFLKQDTIEKIVMGGNLVFSTNGNSITGWTNSTNWGISNAQFVSPSSSITDSPTGNYSNNSNKTLTTPDIDLTNSNVAFLRFYSKWITEKGYDYAQILVSTDNVTWDALCGKYSITGASSHTGAVGQPLYEGTQNEWIKEEIDLTPYTGQTIKLRFKFYADGGVRYDGFYFDDLEVWKTNITAVEDLQHAQVQMVPNPAHTQIHFKNIKAQTIFRIFDIQGKEVHISKHFNDFSLTPDFAEGIYLVEIQDYNGQISKQKLIWMPR